MPAVDATPIADAELAALFDRFAGLNGLALGVSGGADSLALMLLVQRWRAARSDGPDLLVLTVDHGLRLGSDAEAMMVADEARRLGLAHRTLTWRGAKPSAAIEERAREERYRLLADTCRAAGIADLAVAHHRDDQAETVLMRLGKGSGLTGLAGMRRERQLDAGIRLHRPLLGLPRARLVATVRAAGLTAVVDESNSDRRFVRPRLRALAKDLADAGIDAASIAASAERLAEADAAVEHYVGRFFDDAIALDQYAVARIDRAAFRDLPDEMRRRVLQRVLHEVGDGGWPPVRRPRLAALATALLDTDVRRTLGGAVVTCRDGSIIVHREPGRQASVSLVLTGSASGVWDGRFAYRLDGTGDAFTLGLLGEQGRRDLGLTSGTAPRGALAALPALRRDGDIVSVPTVGFHRTDAAFTVKCIAGRSLWQQNRNLER